MKKIVDLTNALEKTLDIKWGFKLWSWKPKFLLSKNSTKDIFKKKKEISLSRWSEVKIMKNSTENFDSLHRESKKEDVILVKKDVNFLDKVVLYNIEKIQKKNFKKILMN